MSKIVRVVDPLVTSSLSSAEVFTSLEGENLGGSVKDYMVRGELQELMARKILARGDEVSEVSAGSTAVSLAHYCREFELKCVLFVPDTIEASKAHKLSQLGADVHFHELSTIYETYDVYCRQNETYRFNQLFDASKRRHYEEFGRTLRKALGPLQLVIGAVGTGLSLRGTAEGAGALSMTAEPAASTVHIPGVRNLELERHGPGDECTPSWFDQRVILLDHEFFAGDSFKSDDGRITYAPSFKLVLGALKKLDVSKDYKKIFLLGASNKHVGL